MDNKKGLKNIEKNFKKNTQKKLISKVFAKSLFRNLEKNSKDVLTKQGIFLDQSIPFIKNEVNDFVLTNSERNNCHDNDLYNFNNDMIRNLNFMKTNKHKDVILARREYLRQMAIDEENRIKAEEERKKQEKIERAERRRLLRIKIFRDSIKKNILDNATIREDIYSIMEIAEIDNNDMEGPFGNYFFIYN